jgi:hypothetical protein
MRFALRHLKTAIAMAIPTIANVDDVALVRTVFARGRIPA